MRRTTRILWGLPIAAIAASVAGLGLVVARETPRPPPEFMFGCVHRWDSTWDCPDFNPQEGVNWVLTQDVESIEIILHMRDGQTRRWTHRMYTGVEDSLNVNAVFFNEEAVWDIWFSYLRARAIDEDSVRAVFRSLPRPAQ